MLYTCLWRPVVDEKKLIQANKWGKILFVHKQVFSNARDKWIKCSSMFRFLNFLVLKFDVLQKIFCYACRMVYSFFWKISTRYVIQHFVTWSKRCSVYYALNSFITWYLMHLFLFFICFVLAKYTSWLIRSIRYSCWTWHYHGVTFRCFVCRCRWLWALFRENGSWQVMFTREWFVATSVIFDAFNWDICNYFIFVNRSRL